MPYGDEAGRSADQSATEGRWVAESSESDRL